MSNLARFTAELFDLDTHYVFNDFNNFASGSDGWTSLAADVGASVAVSDASRGVVTLTTGATNNNEALVRTTTELFIFAAGRPLYARARVQYSEASTDDAAVFFGFMSAMAADSLVDGGAAPKATFDGAGIYKRKDTTVWRGLSCNGAYASVGLDTASVTTAGGSSYQTLEVIVNDYDATYMQATFKVDGQYLKDSNGVVIKHLVAIASAEEMNLGLYVKAGGANSEVVLCDLAYGHQLR